MLHVTWRFNRKLSIKLPPLNPNLTNQRLRWVIFYFG